MAINLFSSEEFEEIRIKTFLFFFTKISGRSRTVKRSEFFCDGVDLLHHKFRRIRFNRGGSYIDPPKIRKQR